MLTTTTQEREKAHSHSTSWKIYLGLGLLTVFVILIRSRLLDFPLERDEGEYAYFGQLILQGIPPYELAYNMKFPGTYLAYALFLKVFGETTIGIHIGLLWLNLLTIFLLFQVGRRLFNPYAGLITAVAYALLSYSPTVLGFAGHATHFVVAAAVGGLLLLLYALEQQSSAAYWSAGFCFGTAVLMKQPGIFFSVFAILAVLYSYRHQRYMTTLGSLFRLTTGMLVPFTLVLLWLSQTGVLEKFWFWTIDYAWHYTQQISPTPSEIFTHFKQQFIFVSQGFTGFWVIALLGLGWQTWQALVIKQERAVILLLFTLCAFLSITPGFYFRPHYFVTLLPAVALLIGAFFNRLAEMSKPKIRHFLSLLLFAALSTAPLKYHAEYFFRSHPLALSRIIYGLNPFIESIVLAEFIKQHSVHDETIAVLGSEPQIYFYSHRHSATGHIYTYPLMEKHPYSLAMQQQMAREIGAAKPSFLVVVNARTSWLRQPQSPTYIFDWLSDYVTRHPFRLVGVVDIAHPPQGTTYKWFVEAQNYQPKSKYFIQVFWRANK
jgi:hypothetical protein